MLLKRQGYLFLLALLPVFAYAGEALYVQSAKVRVLSAPSFQADTIGVILKGTPVEVIETQQRWVKVSHQGKAGWINRLLVSSRPPLKKVSPLEDQPISQGARRRASSAATSAAARGLRTEDRVRLNLKNEFDYSALTQMESLSIDDAEVWRFLKDGVRQ